MSSLYPRVNLVSAGAYAKMRMKYDDAVDIPH